MKFKFFHLLVFFIFSVSIPAQDIEFKKGLIQKMIDAIDKHNQLEFTMYRSERNEKGYSDGEFYAKIQNVPFKLYIKNEKPRPGSEVLYIEGINDNRALINPNSFPYFSISLDPDNNILLAGGHHSVREAGFMLLSNMFKKYQNQYGDLLYEMTTYNGLYKWNERKCHKITIEYADYKTINYTPKKGETLYTISRSQLLNIGKLREYNKDYDDDDILDKDDLITINNVYAKKAVLLIDTENYFPIYQLIHDENGLYEKYHYKNLKTDVNFENEEFSRDFSEYNF